MPAKIEPPEVGDPDAAAKMEQYLNQKIPDPRNFMDPEESETFERLVDRYNMISNNPEFRNDPYSYIILDPAKARSINAQFDPLHAQSTDLMKADGGLVSMADKYAKQKWYEFEEDDGDREYNSYVQKFGGGGLVTVYNRQGYYNLTATPEAPTSPAVGLNDDSYVSKSAASKYTSAEPENELKPVIYVLTSTPIVVVSIVSAVISTEKLLTAAIELPFKVTAPLFPVIVAIIYSP
jgi:hypothetical protein